MLSPRRREGWEEVVFKILFYFSLCYSDLVGNNLNSFPQVKSVLPVIVIGE